MPILPYDELRALYKNFLHGQSISKATINTAYVDTFYLWRKGSKDLFWNAVNATDFEMDAKTALIKALSENSTGNVNSLVSGYSSHLRRFRLFLVSDNSTDPVASNQEKTVNRKYTRKRKMDKLFFELCPKNTDVIDILLKASTLNDFYSTGIFSIYPVAKHIYTLDIDSRLKAGDVTLVRDIQQVTMSDAKKNFYSFASKYCSHHNPLDYPIYDSYVDKVLRYFRNCDGFLEFQDGDLKNYVKFKRILIDFRTLYGLDKYDLKQIDQYVW